MLHLIIFTCPHVMRITLWVMNVSLDTANIDVINILTLDFRIWQHFSRNWTHPHLQTLTNIPEVPVTQLYRDMFNANEPIHSFTIKDEGEDSSLIWKILKHPGTYIGAIGMIFTVCIGVYCFKGFWIRPATSQHQPYFPVSLWHAIVDDDCRGSIHLQKQRQGWKPRWLHRNHDLCIKWEAERPMSDCKQPALAKGVPISRSLAPKPTSWEHNSSNGLL